MAASPSEFLTFFRYAASRGSLNAHALARPIAARSLHTSFAGGLKQKDIGPDRTHVLDKNDTNVQTEASRKGRESRDTQDHTSQAHVQKDIHKSTEKAKKEHPEAPDVVIGMQDERGGKGNQ